MFLILENQGFVIFSQMSHLGKSFVIKLKDRSVFLKNGSFQVFTGASWKFGRVLWNSLEKYVLLGSITHTHFASKFVEY